MKQQQVRFLFLIEIRSDRGFKKYTLLQLMLNPWNQTGQ